RAAIPVDKDTHACQFLADWIVAAGENVYGKILLDFPDLARIGKPLKRLQERRHGRSAKRWKTQRIVDEGVHFRWGILRRSAFSVAKTFLRVGRGLTTP